ncbi:hypothetical protein BX600DRAFT_544432 [Xylariales sp. PMI_506]|nr:hypothetical protein BX600DRAFT_544432 [Xylariales sp. PMI_506]
MLSPIAILVLLLNLAVLVHGQPIPTLAQASEYAAHLISARGTHAINERSLSKAARQGVIIAVAVGSLVVLLGIFYAIYTYLEKKGKLRKSTMTKKERDQRRIHLAWAGVPVYAK